MSLFVLQLRFPPDTGPRLRVRPRHRAYLEALRAAGKVVAAGPWSDDSGAMIVYRAADEAEVQAILAADPYFEEGVAGESVLREWRPLFGGPLT